MNREELESRIRQHFAQEGAQGDISSQQWQEVLSHVRTQKQRRWPWGAAVFVMPRPFMAMAVSLVLLVVVGGVSLWVVAPWQQAAPVGPGGRTPLGAPTGVRGPAGRPAPRIIEATWTVDHDAITPGQALTITGTLKNVWGQRIDNMIFPETVALDLVDTRDVVTVPLTVTLGTPVPIMPGQEVTFVAQVPPDMSTGLQVGRYSVRLDIVFSQMPGRPEAPEGRMRLNSGILFVVVPPQGALNKTVQVGEVREVNGIAVTLEAIYFTPEQTTIVALADLTNYQPPKPTASPTPSRDTTPTPIPTATPIGREYSANPWYRVDGGAWRELRSRGYRQTPEGIHLEWTLGPVPVDAKTLDFAISRLGDFVFNPDQEVIGPWEWTVLLQEAER